MRKRRGRGKFSKGSKRSKFRRGKSKHISKGKVVYTMPRGGRRL